jgi:multidrug efflux system outer membrane protein
MTNKTFPLRFQVLNLRPLPKRRLRRINLDGQRKVTEDILSLQHTSIVCLFPAVDTWAGHLSDWVGRWSTSSAGILKRVKEIARVIYFKNEPVDFCKELKNHMDLCGRNPAKKKKIRRPPWMVLSNSAVLILAVTGCTVGPNYRPPDVAGYTRQGWRAASLEGGQALDGQAQPMTDWWRQFKDQELSSLVERLVGSNLALAEARQRIIEARAHRGIVNADGLPQIDLNADYTSAGTGKEAVSFQGPPPGEEINLYAAGVVAGWELDLWGRVARLVEAADAEIEASYADYHDMMVSLAAELTLAYIDARTLQARLNIVGRNIALQEKTLDLSETRYRAGTGAQLLVAQSKRLLESTRALIPEYKHALTVAENRINLLLGQPPGASVLKPGPLPSVPPLIGIGLPVDLLVRRPDIRAAERRYAAAVAQIGAAEADRYVRLSLSGTLSLQTDTASVLLDKDALIYMLGPGLQFPLFFGGRIRSNIKVRQSQAEQGRLALEQKILAALSEVENAAAGVIRSQEQVINLTASGKAAEQSVHLADNLYRAGLGDFFQVIDAEEKLVAVQEEILLARQNALAEVVQLYRALGGGWQVLECPDGARAPTGEPVYPGPDNTASGASAR